MSNNLQEKKVKVNLDKRSYDIVIGSGLIDEIGLKIKPLISSKRVFIISNPTVFSLYGDRVCRSLKSVGFDVNFLEVSDGENYKSLETAYELYGQLINHNASRFDVIIALGGGVIGDLAGFVAATYMRGLPFIQLPTTLLAQVDSSVGGKVAVNHPKAKNLIGCFYQPRFVLIDIDVLKTLPERELKVGLAEVIKYGFLSGEEFLSFLEEHIEDILAINPEILTEVVLRCCEFKARIVEADEKDFGKRAILNYGHTIGHVIEASSGYKKYRHGEAIAIGMVCAAKIAQKRGLIQEGFVRQHEDILKRAGLPIMPPSLDAKDVMKHLLLDKKRCDEDHAFVLLKGIGEPIIESVAGDDILESLKPCQ
ncbi:3-dehydroquinate synthase [Candidatus Oleimmundimicrobium sp.]|uniref:3-dehydroquinate synthase n=1 Tax=Candidatus Oleimmundimicrobium sp. TaxID=3060597 RepID=UPI00271B6E4A|nr:3-dehydroquinate synthase [Candidatus Oleimmundimicrobium sp.]MDO8886511.1 3-dehydroquinate synthase [Candidatus Oleimmundimicrobium sp.]